jgi:tripartite-type tricarboxylate transporter receptor subunit TctC
VQELIDYLKKNPGKLTYASTGIGSVAHLSVELFKILTGTDMVHVPYRGNAPALTDLLAGNVDLTIDVSSSVASHLTSGALRSLGVTTAKRTSFEPDMPAVAETVPGFEAFSWNGIVVRTGTPPSIVEKVGREFANAVQQPQAKEALARILVEPIGSSPAEFRELMTADAARWDRVVSALNLNPGQK